MIFPAFPWLGSLKAPTKWLAGVLALIVSLCFQQVRTWIYSIWNAVLVLVKAIAEQAWQQLCQFGGWVWAQILGMLFVFFASVMDALGIPDVEAKVTMVLNLFDSLNYWLPIDQLFEVGSVVLSARFLISRLKWIKWLFPG